MSPRALGSSVLPGALCIVIASLSALSAAYDLWKTATIGLSQLNGVAQQTDFLGPYVGSSLLLRQPQATYQLAVQTAMQQSLTGVPSPLVPFYLPPWAAASQIWLAVLPYGIAYLTWLGVGVACVLLAAAWLAPRWTHWPAVAWLGLAMLFLPALLGLAQGQTSALMLACFAAFARGVLDRRRSSTHLVLGLLGWTLKPQLAPLMICSLVVLRRWRSLALVAMVIAVVGGLATVRIGLSGLTDYVGLSHQKLQEVLSADPSFLLGPTLLHASHWFLGVNTPALGVAAVLVGLTLGGCAYLWRRGLACDDTILLQLAVLPVASVIVAPYALVYELTPWLASFWLLWRYTDTRPAARPALLWLTAGVWLAGDIGVATPLAGGADVAALLGLGVVGFIVWLRRTHAVDPGAELAAQSRVHLPVA